MFLGNKNIFLTTQEYKINESVSKNFILKLLFVEIMVIIKNENIIFCLELFNKLRVKLTFQSML